MLMISRSLRMRVKLACTWVLRLVRMANWCVVVLLLLASVGAWADNVIELDSATFDEGIADLEIVLVEFYAPW